MYSTTLHSAKYALLQVNSLVLDGTSEEEALQAYKEALAERTQLTNLWCRRTAPQVPEVAPVRSPRHFYKDEVGQEIWHHHLYTPRGVVQAYWSQSQ